jgi:hypothetical protein
LLTTAALSSMMQQNCIYYYRNGYLNYPADPEQAKITAYTLTSKRGGLLLFNRNHIFHFHSSSRDGTKITGNVKSETHQGTNFESEIIHMKLVGLMLR